MVDIPDVRYVRTGDGVNIAYSRWGRGQHVIVYTPPLMSNVELFWELPEWARVLRHAAEHHECVMLDKRGVGLSDRVTSPPTLVDRVTDTIAVMDAESLGAVDLIGHSEGGVVAIAVAAHHPERVRSLVLIDTPALGVPHAELTSFSDPALPVPTEQEMAQRYRDLVRHWGSATSVGLDLFAPSVSDPRIRRWYQRLERHSASPTEILGLLRSMEGYDIRPWLDSVTARTLVLQARRDRMVHVANGRYLARTIPEAGYREYALDDHLWQLLPRWRDVQDDIIEFITGARPSRAAETAFATVLFTDIVDSTPQAAALGDSAWREVLERHDRIAHDHISRRGGRIVKQTGDGMLASFSDPAAALTAAMEFSREMATVGSPVRAGLHAGVVEIREDGDLTGIAVNIAARVQSRAQANEVLVSETLRDLLIGTDTRFEDRGQHELKGLDGTRRLFLVAQG